MAHAFLTHAHLPLSLFLFTHLRRSPNFTRSPNHALLLCFSCLFVVNHRKHLLACTVLYGTAQNSYSVSHVEYASVDMIRATIAALESDLPPSAVKLGMMGTDAVVSVVGEFLDGYEGKVVCDPVMISTRCALHIALESLIRYGMLA